MHRDIKPQNIAYEPKTKKLRLIDWGLAEFLKVGESYNVRVSSLYYSPPELLLNYQKYDTSLDMWSVGLVMAGMVIIFGNALLIFRFFKKNLFLKD
jgi:casein kinase II subunit alpha